jgi:hypothetical protein
MMKKPFKKPRSVNRGVPSGFLASLALHGIAFFIAGLFVVFTIANKSQPEFEPPPRIERPKMKLKKPKVKVRKSSNPKPSSRIVAKVKTKEMPEILLPDLVGVGEGLMGGTGTGEVGMDIPEFNTVTLLGSPESVGNDLVGTYYDIKRWRNGNVTGIDRDSFYNVVRNFIDREWDKSLLNKYYRLPQNLYATTLMVPMVPSSFMPVAFGNVNASEGGGWIVHYEGKLVHREGITFRFWAAGDIFLIVRIDGEIVVASVWGFRDNRIGWYDQIVGSAWTPSATEHRQYMCGHGQLVAVGDWITLEPGEQKDMEIIVGDIMGNSAAYLMVEEEGVEYETSDQGGPILPAFKTAQPSHDLLDVIYPFLAENEMVCMTNGPVFNDFGGSRVAASPDKISEETEKEAPSGMRTWMLNDGRTIRAEMSDAVSFDDNVPLIDAAGALLKVPYSRLSPADREFIDISRVPELDIDILKSLRQVQFSSKVATYSHLVRDPEIRASFGVRVKQVGSGSYDHQLTAEIFAIGRQIYADRYLLIARDSVSFKLTRDNDRRFEYMSSQVYPLRDIYIGDYARRGEKYYGYIILVTDELGRLVAHEESSEWLIENVDNLRKLKVGNYLDQECNRRYPIRPDPMPQRTDL